MADHHPTDLDGRLRLVLDNMPGALAYTDDDLKIVFCNDRFKEMYKVPQELLQPGRPYADLLRYAAENGYYGEGDVDALVAKFADKQCQTIEEETRQINARSRERPPLKRPAL